MQAFKRRLPWLIKLLVSVALIAYLLDKVGLGSAWSRARSLSPLVVIAATALLAIQATVWALRWRFVIRALGNQLAAGHAIAITYVGLFTNQFLPASIGADVVRMWQSQRSGLPISAAFNAVLLERAGNLLTVSLLAAATSLYWADILSSRLAIWAFPAISVAGLAGIAVLASVDRLPPRWFERRRYLRALLYLSADTRKVFFVARNALGLAALGALGQVILALSMFVLAAGLDINLSPLQCFVVLPPVVIISSLPISVAGWGVRELAMITALGFMGVQAEAALLLSVLLALLVVLVSLPGGLVWLLHRRQREPAPARPVEP